MKNWGSNMYKAAYERNIETCVVKFSGKSVIDCCDNEEYWPQNLVRK